MAITQSRMLALLDIGESLKGSLLTRQHAIADIIAELPPDPTREDLLRTVQLIQTLNAELIIPPSALDTLATERAHFRLHRARNERLARKARQKRGQALDAPSLTAPPTLNRAAAPSHPAISNLSARKLAYNTQYRQYNMPEPYPEPFDDEEPLLPEHGGAASDSDALDGPF